MSYFFTQSKYSVYDYIQKANVEGESHFSPNINLTKQV